MAEIAAEVLVTTTFLGRDCVPGDLVTKKDWDRVSDNVRGPLVRTGVVRLVDGKPPKRAVMDEDPEVKRAKKAEADAKGALAEIRKKATAGKSEIDRAAAERGKRALKAAGGDDNAEADLDRAREAQRIAEMALEDLEEAERQAEAEVAKATSVVHAAELVRRRTEAERLAGERVDVVREIEKLTPRLAKLIGQYENLGSQLASVLDGEGGSQISTRWRLDAHLNEVLGTAFVEPDQRQPFAELERHVLLDEVVPRAMRRLEEGE